MGWSKRDLVNEAYAELALAGYDFDLSPEEMQFGLRRLDTMMASVFADLPLGYAFGTSPSDTDLDQDSGLALFAVEAVYLALAIRIAAGKGKVLATPTKGNAKAAFDALVSRLASEQVQEQQLRTGTPRGAGAKPWRSYGRPFTSTPDTGPLQVADDGGLDFTGIGN
jgi:hypothetical protein